MAGHLSSTEATRHDVTGFVNTLARGGGRGGGGSQNPSMETTSLPALLANGKHGDYEQLVTHCQTRLSNSGKTKRGLSTHLNDRGQNQSVPCSLVKRSQRMGDGAAHSIQSLARAEFIMIKATKSNIFITKKQRHTAAAAATKRLILSLSIHTDIP